jgi:hypothetical protein
VPEPEIAKVKNPVVLRQLMEELSDKENLN